MDGAKDDRISSKGNIADIDIIVRQAYAMGLHRDPNLGRLT